METGRDGTKKAAAKLTSAVPPWAALSFATPVRELSHMSVTVADIRRSNVRVFVLLAVTNGLQGLLTVNNTLMPSCNTALVVGNQRFSVFYAIQVFFNPSFMF